MLVEIIHNDNPDLIWALRDEGLIEDKGTVFSIEEQEYVINLYEGDKYWYFEVWYGDNPYEYIVPKTIPKDIATDIIVAFDARGIYEYAEWLCEDYLELCKEVCERDAETFDWEAEELNDCIQECEENYDRCLSDVEHAFSEYKEIAKEVESMNIRVIDCVSGERAGSPDIGQICAVYIPDKVLK